VVLPCEREPVYYCPSGDPLELEQLATGRVGPAPPAYSPSHTRRMASPPASATGLRIRAGPMGGIYSGLMPCMKLYRAWRVCCGDDRLGAGNVASAGGDGRTRRWERINRLIFR